MDFRKIGKIKSAHGLKGEVYILIFSGDTSWVEKNIVIQLERIQGQFKNYKIEKFKIHKDGIIASFESVNNRNESEDLVGLEVHVSKEIFTSKNGDSIYLTEIEQFQVFNSNQFIGIITGFSTNGSQDILLVDHIKNNKLQLKPIEIPFVSDFVESIDYKQKIVKMNLPEGLIEINNSDEN